MRPDRFFGPLAFMAGEVVEDDDVAWLEGGRKLGFDIGLEDHAVHWGIDDPGGDEAVALEARHEGLRAPMAEGSLAVQPRAFCRASAQARHLCCRACFIDEDQPLALIAHDGLAAVSPRGASPGQFRSVLFAGPKSFF